MSVFLWSLSSSVIWRCSCSCSCQCGLMPLPPVCTLFHSRLKSQLPETVTLQSSSFWWKKSLSAFCQNQEFKLPSSYPKFFFPPPLPSVRCTVNLPYLRMFQPRVQPTSDQKCAKQTLHSQENVKIKEVLCADHAETFTLAWASQWYNLSHSISREQLKHLGGFVQGICKHCAVRHKKLECLQVWIFWNQSWRSTRDEGVLFLSLLSGVLSPNQGCFLQQTLVTCLQILLSPLTLTDVFTLTLRAAFLSSRGFLPSALSHSRSKLVCL